MLLTSSKYETSTRNYLKGLTVAHMQLLKGSTHDAHETGSGMALGPCLVVVVLLVLQKESFMHGGLNKIYLQNLFTDKCNFAR